MDALERMLIAIIGAIAATLAIGLPLFYRNRDKLADANAAAAAKKIEVDAVIYGKLEARVSVLEKAVDDSRSAEIECIREQTKLQVRNTALEQSSASLQLKCVNLETLVQKNEALIEELRGQAKRPEAKK